MNKKRLLVISNCQGPTLFNRFIRPACPAFDQRFEWLPAVQVHLLKPQHAERVQALVAQADVILAQPVENCVVAAATLSELQRAAPKTGAQLLTFPALHFDALAPGMDKRSWPASAAYPFGYTEEWVLAACHVRGLSPARAAQVYHELPLANAQQMQQRIDRNLADFRLREERHATDVVISDFYARHWSELRLHHVKSHPTVPVYQALGERMAGLLGLPTPDWQTLTDPRGNDQFDMPVKQWVKSLMGLRYEDDPGQARLDGEVLPFTTVIQRLWDFYATQGDRDSLARHLGLERFAWVSKIPTG